MSVGSLAGRARRRAGAVRDQRAATRPLGPADLCTGDTADPLVSMTTFPARLGQVHLPLRTLLRQSVRPGAVELVLSREEVPPADVPAEVRALEDRGVRLRFVAGNARSYKKLLPALEAHPDRTVVTVDDDVLYPPGWLADLLRARAADPAAVLGHRGTQVRGSRDAPAPYVTWPPATPLTPSGRTFLTGMGGILYPPGALAPQATDLDLARRLCPTADDIWFKAMALLAGTTTRRVSSSTTDFPTLRRAQRHSLRAVNVGQGHNDSQFRAVMDHLDLWDALGP